MTKRTTTNVLHKLSKTELDALRYACRGYTQIEIAESIGRSLATVKKYFSTGGNSIPDKLGVRNSNAAIALYARNQFINEDEDYNTFALELVERDLQSIRSTRQQGSHASVIITVTDLIEWLNTNHHTYPSLHGLFTRYLLEAHNERAAAYAHFIPASQIWSVAGPDVNKIRELLHLLERDYTQELEELFQGDFTYFDQALLKQGAIGNISNEREKATGAFERGFHKVRTLPLKAQAAAAIALNYAYCGRHNKLNPKTARHQALNYERFAVAHFEASSKLMYDRTGRLLDQAMVHYLLGMKDAHDLLADAQKSSETASFNRAKLARMELLLTLREVGHDQRDTTELEQKLNNSLLIYTHDRNSRYIWQMLGETSRHENKRVQKLGRDVKHQLQQLGLD